MTSDVPAHCTTEVLAESLPALPAEASGDERARDAWHPHLKRLYEYWKSIHPPRGLPGRQEFDPSAVLVLLPIFWILTFKLDRFPLPSGFFGPTFASPPPGELPGNWAASLDLHTRTFPDNSS